MAKDIVDDKSIKCNQCGGALIFDPVTQAMKCEYCEGQFNIENQGEIKENDINEALKNIKKDNWNGVKVLKCNSCGAQVVIQNEGVSTKCSFCGSSHIVIAEEPVGIIPDGIIPFTISKEMAVEKFKESVCRNFFAPNEIKQMNPKSIKGVYVPYWTYDAVVNSTYNVEAGSYYYISVSKIRTVDGRKETYIDKERHTQWDWRNGSDNTAFDDIIAPAFSGKYRQNSNCQFDFNFKMAQPYNLQYLSGFEVEKPMISIVEGFNNHAKTLMQQNVSNSIKNTIHSDTYRNLDITSNYSKITYKLMLAPVWTVAYMHKGKPYQSIVNAQNGAVSGKVPIAVKKLLGFIGALTAALIIFTFSASLISDKQYEQDMKSVNTYIENGEYTDAINILSDKIENNSFYQDIYVTYAQLCIDQKDYQKAYNALLKGKTHANDTEQIDALLELVKPYVHASTSHVPSTNSD